MSVEHARAVGALLAALLQSYRYAGQFGLTDREAARIVSEFCDVSVTARQVGALRRTIIREGILASVGDRWVWTGGIQ